MLYARGSADMKSGLAAMVVALEDFIAALDKNNGLTLVLALSYSGRSELVDAVRAIAAKTKEGRLDPADINERNNFV